MIIALICSILRLLWTITERNFFCITIKRDYFIYFYFFLLYLSFTFKTVLFLFKMPVALALDGSYAVFAFISFLIINRLAHVFDSFESMEQAFWSVWKHFKSMEQTIKYFISDFNTKPCMVIKRITKEPQQQLQLRRENRQRRVSCVAMDPISEIAHRF